MTIKKIAIIFIQLLDLKLTYKGGELDENKNLKYFIDVNYII